MMRYTTSHKGPNPIAVMLFAMVMVFGAYLLWSGFMNWIEEGSRDTRTRQRTQVAESTVTAEAFFDRPQIVVFPTNTPVPTCEYFYVRGPDAAFVRECPSTSCKDVGFVEADENICVIGRANNPDYARSNEWYEVLLDPEDILPEIFYMHQSVLRAVNPTATPSPTIAPLPTVTRTPTPEVEIPQESPTPNSPTTAPSPASGGTVVEIEI